MESGQFLIPGGSGPTRFDPNAATRDGRTAPSTTVDPRSAAPSSGRFSAVLPPVRVSDNRWPARSAKRPNREALKGKKALRAREAFC